MSFKERVKIVLIKSSKIYKEYLIDREYLIYSSKFKYKKYYEVTAKDDNFLHLTGVSTSLKAKEFFRKCYEETLSEDDFEVGNLQQKGSIRRKINILQSALTMFYDDLVVEEKFIKNKVSCSFASSDNIATIGFTKTDKAKPQTLLKGNILKNTVEVEAIFFKGTNEVYYNKVVRISTEKELFILEDLKEIVKVNIS